MRQEIPEIVKLTPSGICIYKDYSYLISHNTHQFTAKETKQQNERGTLSINQIRNLRKYLYLLKAISPLQTQELRKEKKLVKFRLNTITLTLPTTEHTLTDQFIRSNLLNDFFTRARKKYKLKDYVWKAETQENGNIHFHIVTNTFINYQDIKDTWNNVLRKTDLIDKFAEKHNHYNPPTTEITSLRNEKACVSYIATYLSKKDRYKKKLAHYLQKPKVITTSENIQYSPLPKDYYENLKRRIDGKIWDCSLSLKKAPVCSWTMKNEDFWLLKRIERTFPERMIYKDTFQFLPLSEYEITKKLPAQYTQKYLKWIKRIKLGNKKQKISFETQERLKTFRTKEKTLCTLNFLNGCPLSLN